MTDANLTSKDIRSWEFCLYYHGKLKKLDMGRMSYLCYINLHRKYFYTEHELYYTDETGVNEALTEWYPIKKTAKSCWHIHKMNLVNMGLLDDGYVYCPDSAFKGAVILNNDFDEMCRENKEMFDSCAARLKLIADYYNN